MKIILCEDVENVGEMGQTVKVSPGYARNFLLPRRLAVAADSASAHQMLGFFQTKLQQNLAAVASYSRAAALDSGSPDINVELAMAQSAAGMTDAAIKTFEAGIRRFPRHAMQYQA